MIKFEKEPDGKTWSLKLCHYGSEGRAEVKVSKSGELLAYSLECDGLPDCPGEWNARWEKFWQRWNSTATTTSPERAHELCENLE